MDATKLRMCRGRGCGRLAEPWRDYCLQCWVIGRAWPLVLALALLASPLAAQIPTSVPPGGWLPPAPPVVVVAPAPAPTPEPTPTPAPECTPAPPPCAAPVKLVVTDPLAAESHAEGWVWGQRYWAPPAAPRDLAGGRIQAQIGIGHWGIAFRGDVSGMPGQFQPDKPETFQSAEGYLAAHVNVASAQGVVIGFGAGFGSGFSLETRDGVKPVTAHAATFGAGIRVSSPSWWVYAVYGEHQALPGTALVVLYQVRTSDRTAAVGTLAVGSTGHYIAQFGVAVRWF